MCTYINEMTTLSQYRVKALESENANIRVPAHCNWEIAKCYDLALKLLKFFRWEHSYLYYNSMNGHICDSVSLCLRMCNFLIHFSRTQRCFSYLTEKKTKLKTSNFKIITVWNVWVQKIQSSQTHAAYLHLGLHLNPPWPAYSFAYSVQNNHNYSKCLKGWPTMSKSHIDTVL